MNMYDIFKYISKNNSDACPTPDKERQLNIKVTDLFKVTQLLGRSEDSNLASDPN